jgi:hypothetical protein
MAYTTRLLVIANVTASSPDLIAALKARAGESPLVLTLLMPATKPGITGREAVQARLDEALAAWREAGLEAAGEIGDSDPIEAVHEAWRPGRFDEVLVSTLPGASSKWMQFDLPHRVAKITDAKVQHVEAHPADWQPHKVEPVPPRERRPLGPLSLGRFGGNKG